MNSFYYCQVCDAVCGNSVEATKHQLKNGPTHYMELKPYQPKESQ